VSFAIGDRADDSVVPTRFFLAKPAIGEELTIAIEKGKTLTIKLLAVGPLNPEKGTRECFFELNGEVSVEVDQS
jgi:pyruvate carboxylase